MSGLGLVGSRQRLRIKRIIIRLELIESSGKIHHSGNAGLSSYSSRHVLRTGQIRIDFPSRDWLMNTSPLFTVSPSVTVCPPCVVSFCLRWLITDERNSDFSSCSIRMKNRPSMIWQSLFWTSNNNNNNNNNFYLVSFLYFCACGLTGDQIMPFIWVK